MNKADPAVLVEKRFGVGYTVNFGNPLGLGLMLFVLLLLAAVTGLALWAAAG